MPECQIIMWMRQIRGDSRKDRLIRDLPIYRRVQLGAQGITGLVGVRNHEFGRCLGYADVFHVRERYKEPNSENDYPCEQEEQKIGYESHNAQPALEPV